MTWKTVSLDAERVRDLYESGMTQREIAAVLGVGATTVWNAMHRHGIKARPAIKRDQWGEKNAGWKGANASYNRLHERVKQARGRASSCDECGASDPTKRYDWANVSGRYDSVDDYRSLCRSCHQRFDHKRRDGGRRMRNPLSPRYSRQAA